VLGYRPVRGGFSVGEGVAYEHGVLALGAGRQEGDRGANQLFEPPDVFDRGRRKVGPGARTAGTLAPAFGALIDRFELSLNSHPRGEIVISLSAMAVSSAELDLLEAVEHIEFG